MANRKYNRKHIQAKAFISIDGTVRVAKVTDVSAGGVLVETREHLPVGSEVEVVITSNKGQTATFVGEVIRQTESGVAFKMRERSNGANPLSKIFLSA